MIIGSGSLAKLIKDREGAIFFCSGVGNSSNTDSFQFARESNTLTSNYVLNSAAKRHLVYFSSIAIFTCTSPYFEHKKNMERVMRECFESYTIVRLGNIWECTNQHTFLNAIKAKQQAREPVEIRDEYRYMISADQLNMVLQGLPLTGRNEISIFSEMLTVQECLNRVS